MTDFFDQLYYEMRVKSKNSLKSSIHRTFAIYILFKPFYLIKDLFEDGQKNKKLIDILIKIRY